MKKVLAAVLGVLFMVGSVVTVADAAPAKIPFYNGAQESAHGNANKTNLANTATLVKAGSGYLGEYCNVGTVAAVASFYDSATTGGAASSNLLYTATAATNTCVVLELPFANGLVVQTAGATTILAVAYR